MKNGSQRTGDSVAAAIDRYGAMVYRLAYARTRSAADADDIFQEVFLKLLTHAPAFQSDGHEKAWLIRATVNASVNLLKSAWRRLEGAPLPDSPTAPELLRDESLADALQSLSAKSRVVIHLYYYEDMTTDEIAEALGMNPASVRARLSRGRKQLKRLLTEREEEM